MIKTMYICWLQGFDKAPKLVKKCVQSWKFYNPDWTIVLLDYKNLKKYVNLEDYIPDIFSKSIEKCHLADIIRSIILKTHGGLWTDSTTFCNKPLTSWLPNYIKEGFFAFNQPFPDVMISNWFLYSEKNGYIIKKWCNETIDYYKLHDKAHTYLIHHKLFEKIYNADATFKKIWDKVPKLSSLSNKELTPHYLFILGYFKKMTVQNKIDIDSKITPLYKLSYKTKFPLYNENLLIYYLFSTIPSNKSITKKLKYYNRKSKKNI